MINGYYANDVLVMTTVAISKLLDVQNAVAKDGYKLVIYDAYRPSKAVNDFVIWAQDLNNTMNKPIYYPDVPKNQIIPEGYVSNKSSHSRGSTVDLTLIPLDRELNTNPTLLYREIKDGRVMPFYNDSSLDMGSSFDLFDPTSWPTDRNIGKEQYNRRMYLQQKMEENGFVSYPYEWWHFTLSNEPFPDTYFDFDICSDYNSTFSTVEDGIIP